MKIIPYLDYDKKGLFSDREFSEGHYIPLYKDETYVSDYRHALFLMVNDVKNNQMMGRINTYQKIALPEGMKLPVDLSSREDFVPLADRVTTTGKVKIAMLGGFGPAYGDNICGVTAYKILLEELSKYFDEFKVDIFHVQSNKFREFYSRYGIEIFQEPLELEQFCGYDYYYDITAINSISGYHMRSIVDSFLWMFSLDFQTIEKSKKRNQYLFSNKNEELVNRIKSQGRVGSKVLFHPDSVQDCRNLPMAISHKIIAEILEKTDYDVFTVSDIEYESPRFFNVKELSKMFDDFAMIISLMDKIVTVDTASYHLADAFSLPTMVVFTNAGEGRIADYPQAQGYVIDPNFLEELEDIRASSLGQDKEYEILNNRMAEVWAKLNCSKIVDFLLATE